MLTFLSAKHAAFLDDLNRIQSRAERAQRQLSTGLRMNTISDQPDQIGVLLQSRAELASTQQTRANLSRTRTEVDAAEIAVQNGIKAVERIRVLGSQGLTGTASTSSRKVIAGEVESLFRQLVNIANTAIDGRYIFAGSADQAPPYTVNLTTPSGTDPYAGGNATRQIADSSGVRLSVAHTGQEIFDNTTSAAEKKVISLQAQIADTEGADLAESILELQDAATHRQAALQAKAQEDRRTVFDFIR